MRRYRPAFHIVHTEQEAIEFCEYINSNYTYYMRKNHPAHYTEWSNYDGTETGFVCWYQY